jgi:hypothetical protein
MHVYLASNGVKKLKIFSIRQANNVLKNETNMFEKYLKRVDTKDSTGTGIYESTKMCDSWYSTLVLNFSPFMNFVTGHLEQSSTPLGGGGRY